MCTASLLLLLHNRSGLMWTIVLGSTAPALPTETLCAHHTGIKSQANLHCPIYPPTRSSGPVVLLLQPYHTLPNTHTGQRTRGSFFLVWNSLRKKELTWWMKTAFQNVLTLNWVPPMSYAPLQYNAINHILRLKKIKYWRVNKIIPS